MSKVRTNIPQADLLMGSMRSMGYSFEAAIADVIDNSVSAHAKNIRLLFPSDPLGVIAVGILDDGQGMSSSSLFEAMRYGSSSSETTREIDDLGRFGLGLKSASLSQCRKLTVISKEKGKRCSAFSWDYNLIQEEKKWIVVEYDVEEITNLPYYSEFSKQSSGTLVIWQDFDVIAKSSDGQVFETLNELKDSVYGSVSLIFHRYLSSASDPLCMFLNNQKIKPQDPFLENHKKTTTKKERTIAIKDSEGKERQIKVKPFILPFATDLKESDKKLVGGIENLRAKQGFYVYRNRRLIIWGTWFGMKPRAELTKNARIRVDIPNTLDDIWSIDIKKQTAAIPKRIQNQLKETVRQALEISVTQQTHRGRRENIDDDKDYIWDRMRGRDNTFYYQVKRDSKLYQYVRANMTDSDFALLEMLVGEIERNIPTHQMYVDKANDAIFIEEPDNRFDQVFVMGVSLIDMTKRISSKPVREIIDEVMKSEPFCNYPKVKDKFLENYKDEITRK